MGLFNFGRTILQLIFYFPFDMIRRFSRSTFAYVSSLIRYGRFNDGKGLPSTKSSGKEITASEDSDEKTPLVDSSKEYPNFKSLEGDVENQRQNVTVDIKSRTLNLLPTAAAMSTSGHKRMPSKEDLETVIVTTTAEVRQAGGETASPDLSPPATKRLRQEPGVERGTVVTFVNEVTMDARKPSKNSASETASSSSPVRQYRKKNKHKSSNKTDKPKPQMNYFVAVQVQDSEIRNNIAAIQERMLNATDLPGSHSKHSKSPTSIAGTVFKETMVPVEKLHFTLHVVHLKDEEDKEKAKSILENVWRQYRVDFEQTPVLAKITGLGQFRNNVIFAKMDGAESISRMTALAESIRAEFEAINIVGETRAFTPHMTVAKISRSKKLLRKNIKAFPRALWSDMQAMEFGQQKVNSIQLLSMQDKVHEETGYYHALAEFHFNFGTSSS